MKRSLAISLLSVGLLLVASIAQADSVTLVATPSATTSDPGSTVGWAYTITNNTPDILLADSVNVSSYQGGTFDLTLFDYPTVGPGGTATQLYDPILFTGLAQFTWDTTAPPGTVNTGFFTFGFDLIDPVTGADLGTFNVQAPYSFSTTEAVSEPASLVFLALGFCALLLFGRKLGIS